MSEERVLSESEENVLPLKKPALDEKQVVLWRNRFQTANKLHRQRISEKYRTAKRRYNSEAYGFEKKQRAWTHQTFNLLYKDIEDFNGSTYFKNPEIDLICRETENPVMIRNIENLEQAVNDDIKDNQSLKALIRSCLVDESLSGIGGVYIDYDYRTKDSDEPLSEGDTESFKQIEVANKVRPVKILPENLIYPPFHTLYNYQESPYLGYVDIVSLESLLNDTTLDQSAVKMIKGKPYLELSDFDKEELKSEKVDLSDDLLYAKIYCGFIRGSDNEELKRCVIADQGDIKIPLAYYDWDKGNGEEDNGYPIHLLALNDPADGFIPPSEAWILESILCIIDYLMTKMMRHLKRSKTRTLVKGGKDGMKKENIEKYLSSEDLEILALHNLPPGMNIQSLVMQLQDQPLSSDHSAMFDLAKRIFDELSRKPSFAQSAVIQQKKTATEAEAIQQQDSSQGAYKIDKFRDFLKGFFLDWAKLKQKNFRGIKNLSVKNKETQQMESREAVVSEDRNDFEGSFGVDISVDSFVMPNKALKRRMIKETIMDLQSMVPMLGGKKKINGERATLDMLQNVDVRNPNEYLTDVPVRTVDQQVMDLAFKGIPMSIDELGTDYAGAKQRLMQIFGDHQLVAQMSVNVPNIGLPDGPIAMMARDLEAMEMQAKGEKTAPTQAKTDVGMNASVMAEAQQ